MSSSNAVVISAGGHVRALHNFLQGSKRQLTWREEVVEVSQQNKCPLWRVTAVVDGEPLGFGSGPRLKTAKARAAEDSSNTPNSPDMIRQKQTIPIRP
ncbi:hypothetical protein BS47DRAFT_1385304 [Hydnum rufescens UP504]|uniref:DRBM domain-containing protein n=1 Tax=Hydnum rufescens UP504 TaxID=1448309 RepID=A0A9P6AKM1_9AGAM|nr:hypothetical protein BS47DRAFT_1385304 [Hydnum rufescens UP504]